MDRVRSVADVDRDDGQRTTTAAWHRLARICCAVIGFFSWQPAGAAPAVKPAANSDLAIVVAPDQIRWGEEVAIDVSAVNGTGASVAGGIYVSFDDDILVLDAKGGTVLRENSVVYNLKTAASRAIRHIMVESWEEVWKPGAERRVSLVVLPLTRQDTLRVLVRATFIGAAGELLIAPDATQEPARDETEFPARPTYVSISHTANLRRTLRSFELLARDFDESKERRFASALAATLEDQHALKDLFPDTGGDTLRPRLIAVAPRIAARLRSDPLVALDNLRCVMIDLNCDRALVYFGLPLAIYDEPIAQETARLSAKQRVEKERGGPALIALYDAERISYRYDEAANAIIVEVNSKEIRVKDGGNAVVPRLLDETIAALGAAAERTHLEVGDMSFARLRSTLSAKGAVGR